MLETQAHHVTKMHLYFLMNLKHSLLVCWCSGPHPTCSQVRVEPDGWVGADPSWLTGVLMSLTVYLPCPNLPFKNLSVTHRASWSCSLSLTGTVDWIIRKKQKTTHSSQDLKLWSKVLTWPTPGSVEIQNPVILTQQDLRPEGLWIQINRHTG